MGSETFQSTLLWPLTFLIETVYYGRVLLHYFRKDLKITLNPMNRVKTNSGRGISLNWDEQVLGLELHCKMISNPLPQLTDDERSLMEKSPYQELILQTTSK